MIKEHLIAHIDVNDSYLKKLLRDHALSVIQNAIRTNTLKSYGTYFSKWERWTERFEEVKPLPAEGKYVGGYLLDLVKQGETFNVIKKLWFAIKAYHKFCGYHICGSFFVGAFMKASNVHFSACQIKSLLSPHVIYCRCITFSKGKIRILEI